MQSAVHHITRAYLEPAGMLRIAGSQMAWKGCAAIQNPLRSLTAESVHAGGLR